METIYLGMWGNYSDGHPTKESELQHVLDTADELGAVQVSFNYLGFTKEEIVGHEMLNRAIELGYTGTVGYRKKLTIYGREQAND